MPVLDSIRPNPLRNRPPTPKIDQRRLSERRRSVFERGTAVQELNQPIGRVWRRLRFQRFLSALVWCLGLGLAVVAIALAVEKFTNRTIPGPEWLPFAVAGGLGLLVAVGIAVATGP